MVAAVVVLGLAGLAHLASGRIEQAVMPLLPVAALHSLAGHAEGAERTGTLGGAVSFVIWSGVAIAVAWWRLVHEDV